MAMFVFRGDTVFMKRCVQFIFVVILSVCFARVKVSGTCLSDDGTDNCSFAENITCSSGSCINENIEPKVSTICLLEDGTDNCSIAENATCLSGSCNNESTESTNREGIATKCDDGYHKENCTVTCPSNCLHLACDNSTRDCIHGCRAGYQGVKCEAACSKGFFGDDCKQECSAHCVTNDCNHENGSCLHGCKNYYWGTKCDLIGEFKDNPETLQQKFYSHLSAESKSILLYILMGKYEETLERAQMEINRGIQQRNELRALMGTG